MKITSAEDFAKALEAEIERRKSGELSDDELTEVTGGIGIMDFEGKTMVEVIADYVKMLGIASPEEFDTYACNPYVLNVVNTLCLDQFGTVPTPADIQAVKELLFPGAAAAPTASGV